MPSPVVRFVIRGPDRAALEQFYGAVFGWQCYEVAPDFAVVDTLPSHEHDPETGADINQPITIDVSNGVLIWRLEGEPRPGHLFVEGTPEGGIGSGPPGVTLYIEVDDLAATLEEVERNGGTVLQQPFEIPGYTTVARFTDPAGNAIGIQKWRR